MFTINSWPSSPVPPCPEALCALPLKACLCRVNVQTWGTWSVHTFCCLHGMTPAEHIAALEAENATLRQQVTDLQAHLTAALAHIAELENRPKDPPAFVNPNTPKREHKPRHKRKAEHNRARRLEATPTRI